MSIGVPSAVNAGSCSRNKYNAILKAGEVERDLVADFHERIRELSDAGLNQTQIAESLACNELARAQYHYGNAEILRTAVSSAVRQILTPEEAEERRLEAWRTALAGNTTSEGRSKGTRARNALHGLPGGVEIWSDEEKEVLKAVTANHMHPAGSRYFGSPDWNAVAAAMTGMKKFPVRQPNAYKQRYSILMKEANNGNGAH